MGDEQILYFPSTGNEWSFRIDRNSTSGTFTIYIGDESRRLDETESDFLSQLLGQFSND